MTLDTYADLFDHDLNSVADSVGKMWADSGQRPKIVGKTGSDLHVSKSLLVPSVRFELTLHGF